MSKRKEFVVYLSSTLADLNEEREVALRTISEVGVVRTSYRADEQGAVETCTGDVRGSDLYVGILAQRYGYVPPQAEDNLQSRSITELEYEACLRPGQAAIPRLMFIKSPKAGIAGEHIDAISHPETADRMKALLTRANKDQVAFLFNNLDEFRAELRIRVREQSDRFHRAASGDHTIFSGERWKRQLAPLAVACVPGTDALQQAQLAALGGERVLVFELSPADPAYLTTLDAGLAHAQVAALLITSASLARIRASSSIATVKAGIEMLTNRSGHAVIITEGIDLGALPPEWSAANQLDLPAGALTGPDASDTLAALYERVRALVPSLTREPRLALPYMVIAPTQYESLMVADPAGDTFSGFTDGAVKEFRKLEFESIAEALRKLDPNWPKDVYGAERYDWRCFGAQSLTADVIVRESIARLNGAPPGSREKRFLKTAHLVPRRYKLEEFLKDHLGSRQAVLAVRNSGCLFMVDEVALLYPVLRAAADALLTGSRSAIVAVTPCDPSHSHTDKLLGDFSFLHVGALLTRFKTELDPQCEIALNSMGRIERWLRAALPELVASAEDQQSVPSLGARMAQVLAQ